MKLLAGTKTVAKTSYFWGVQLVTSKFILCYAFKKKRFWKLSSDQNILNFTLCHGFKKTILKTFSNVRVIMERSYRIPVDISMIWWSFGTTSSLISTDWTPILGNIFFKKSTRFSSSKAKSTVISHFLAVFFRYKWSPRISWRFGTTQSQVSLMIYVIIANFESTILIFHGRNSFLADFSQKWSYTALEEKKMDVLKVLQQNPDIDTIPMVC